MEGQIPKRYTLAQAFNQYIHVLLANPIHTSIPQHVEALSIAWREYQHPQSHANQFFHMKGVLDDLPSQDRSQFDGNALAEGPVSGGGSDEMMRKRVGKCIPICAPP